jgi:hypothetical protein
MSKQQVIVNEIQRVASELAPERISLKGTSKNSKKRQIRHERARLSAPDLSKKVRFSEVP